MCIWLSQLGSRVTGYALAPPTSPNLFDAARVSELLDDDCRADIRDLDHLSKVIGEVQPHFVFHLAAQSLVLRGYEMPRETFETNIVGTVNVLEGIRLNAKPCVTVVVTTDKCYVNQNVARGYREEDALGGVDPYSASKAAAEMVAGAYARSFFASGSRNNPGIAMATARAGNVIGGGDWAENRLVADIAKALAKNERVHIRNPGAVRPFQHVLEPLSGYLVLAARMADDPADSLRSPWNFGPRTGEELTVRELVRRFCDAWGGGQWEERPDPNAPHEAETLRLSIDKALTLLSWAPKWSTDEAISRTAQWYRASTEPAFAARDACRQDIDDYMRDEVAAI